jgi:hypothetical protein
VGAPPSSGEGPPQATLSSWGSGFEAPPHVNEVDQPCFARIKGPRRPPGESMDGRTGRRLPEL